MIVCLCNGLNEDKIIKSVRQMLKDNASDQMIHHLFEYQCGKCMLTVKNIIDDLRRLEDN